MDYSEANEKLSTRSKNAGSWIQEHILGVGLGIIVLIVLLVMLLGSIFAWDWVGIVEYSYRPDGTVERVIGKKTIWDLVAVLIIPLILALGGYWFSRIEARREQSARTRENYLTYLDKMSELIDEGLTSEEGDPPKRLVARARTITVLRGVSMEEKLDIIAFLFVARLIIATYSDSGIVDLRDADLRNVDFTGLAGSNYYHLDLSGAKLIGANFSRSDLMWAHFIEADLSEALFADSYTDLRETVFYRSTLRKTVFRKASMRRAILIETDSRGAVFEDADLQDAYFILANASKANFSNVKAYGLDARGAKLSFADFGHADLRKANFGKVLMKGNKNPFFTSGMPNVMKFFDEKKVYSDEVETELKRAVFLNATLYLADFSYADLEEANLRNSDLRGANLNEANLHSADLRGANLSSIDLGQFVYQGDPNKRTTLKGADMSSANLQGADLSMADLSGAIVTEAQLQTASSVEGAIFPDGSVHS